MATWACNKEQKKIKHDMMKSACWSERRKDQKSKICSPVPALPHVWLEQTASCLGLSFSIRGQVWNGWLRRCFICECGCGHVWRTEDDSQELLPSFHQGWNSSCLALHNKCFKNKTNNKNRSHCGALAWPGIRYGYINQDAFNLSKSACLGLLSAEIQSMSHHGCIKCCCLLRHLTGPLFVIGIIIVKNSQIKAPHSQSKVTIHTPVQTLSISVNCCTVTVAILKQWSLFIYTFLVSEGCARYV